MWGEIRSFGIIVHPVLRLVLMNLKTHFLIIVLAILALVGINSCSSTQKIKSGDVAFAQKSYSLAANLYQTEYGKEADPQKKAKKAFRIAESFRFNGQLDKAEKWYEEAVKLGYNEPIATFNYGLALKANGKYLQAVDQFGNYAKLEPFSKQKAFDEIKSCQQAIKWEKERNGFDVVNLKEANSSADEFAPVFDKDKNIIFTSDRVDATGNDTYGWTGEKYMDLYLTKRDADGGYHGITPFNAVNSGANEGSPIFNKDFTEMYFTRCGSQGKADDYCKIYHSEMESMGGWNAPQEVRFFDNDTINVGQPFLLKDGSAILFSSNAPGGYGGKDLYISYKSADGSWGKPENLGSGINTAGDEMFPTVDDDGTLYFSSNGWPGLGGLDIFSASKKGNIWVEPQNMKIPINSSSDDFALLMEKTKPNSSDDPIRMVGYFTSNRPGGSGRDDIYQFTLSNENIYVMEGIVLEKIFQDPKDPNSRVVDFTPLANANVTLSKAMPGLKDVGTATTDQYGRFKFDLEKETDYVVAGKKDGYLKHTVEATTKGKRDLKHTVVTVKVNVLLEKIFEEQEIIIPNIYYDFDKSDLRPEAETVLDTIVNMMKDNPEIKVQISSHTDSRGSEDYNLKLSQARAESVVRYLVSKDIDLQRLTAVGYGDTHLINKCAKGVECTEEEHAKNRRTTFKILSEKYKIESVVPDTIMTVPKQDKK